MKWLFAKRLRPFVLRAAAASLVLNLALLVPSLYVLHVFDRALASSSIDTLVMMSLASLLVMLLAYAMQTARARALASAGRLLDEQLSLTALSTRLRRAAASGGADDDSLHDIAELRRFMSSPCLHAMFDAPWLPVSLLLIGWMHPLLGVAAALGALGLAGTTLLTERLTRQRADATLKAARQVDRQTQALARRAEVIVGLGMMGAALASWRSRQSTLLDAQDGLAAVSRRLSAATRISRLALQLLMFGLGGWLVMDGQASTGVVVAASLLVGRALQPMEQLVGGWQALVDARGAWQRLQERSAPEPAPNMVMPVPNGELNADGLVFSAAPDRAALIRGLSFQLGSGESLGIVGASASGKTTLLRLLLGILKPQAGAVRMDGADVTRWERSAWGPFVGYLPQDVQLFAGTVAENIARLGAVDSHQVTEAAQLAHAHEMILRLPQGYDTPVGEAGAALSGGQRQRIALARALYGDPRLVVLDEPSAHLDAEGEQALLEALKAMKLRRVTVVMASHRLALMEQLDKVAVLRDGMLDAFGPAAAVIARLQPVSGTAMPGPLRPVSLRPVSFSIRKAA